MHSRGFTLVEILAVLTISAILVALALPSFTAMINSNRISGASNSFLASLDLARGEAIRRSNFVTICRSTNADQAVPACSSAAANGYAAADWASGWIVFAKNPINANNDVFENNDEVLYRQTPGQPMAQTRLIVESTLPNAQSFTFNAQGLTLQGGFQGTTLFIDHRDTQVALRSNMARCLQVSAIGRSRVARVVNDVCPAA